jgi:hypothetical protein
LTSASLAGETGGPAKAHPLTLVLLNKNQDKNCFFLKFFKFFWGKGIDYIGPMVLYLRYKQDAWHLETKKPPTGRRGS